MNILDTEIEKINKDWMFLKNNGLIFKNSTPIYFLRDLKKGMSWEVLDKKYIEQNNLNKTTDFLDNHFDGCLKKVSLFTPITKTINKDKLFISFIYDNNMKLIWWDIPKTLKPSYQ